MTREEAIAYLNGALIAGVFTDDNFSDEEAITMALDALEKLEKRERGCKNCESVYMNHYCPYCGKNIVPEGKKMIKIGNRQVLVDQNKEAGQ